MLFEMPESYNGDYKRFVNVESGFDSQFWL